MLSTVIRYLLAKDLKEAAHQLATASLTAVVIEPELPFGDDPSVSITLEGGPIFFDYFERLESAAHDDWPLEEDRDDRNAYQTIKKAIQHALPNRFSLNRLESRLLVNEVAENWRQDILRELDGQGGHNQCATLPAQEVLTWRNLRFRSLSEVKIAEALDRAKVMFLANCRARLGEEKRGNLEPDFLVCHKGVWGILEVDGEPFHPPTRTVHDHQRDRTFHHHGVKLIQHYDATRCRNEPDVVVGEFLVLLEKVRQ
jgi:hypothetical protein